MFKTKTHLSETLQVEVKINGQILRRMAEILIKNEQTLFLLFQKFITFANRFSLSIILKNLSYVKTNFRDPLF